MCVGARMATVSYRERGYIPAKPVMPAPIWLARHRQEPSHERPVIDMRPHSERFALPGEERHTERKKERSERGGGGGDVDGVGGGGGGGLRHLSPRQRSHSQKKRGKTEERGRK